MALWALNKTRGTILAERAEDATAFLARFLGLMGRRACDFGQGAGLHLVPCNSIHTFFMRMSIDALFLDAEGKVVKAYASLPPWRVTGMSDRARSVLELPPGTLAGSKTDVGDEVVFERR